MAPETRASILVVDDESQNRELISRCLNQCGYETFQASNTKDALTELLRQPMDLILLDVMMPGGDGFSFCQSLRKNAMTQMIPVIFLTAKDMAEDRLTGFQSGADDYMSKPFDLSELKARVRAILERRRRDLSCHPLTHLPGALCIQAEAEKRLLAKQAFSFAYIDIDHFKAFNDAYGYKKGDSVIRMVADLMVRESTEHPEGEPYTGHIGGDDFVYLGTPSSLNASLLRMITRFDELRQYFYPVEDWKSGGFTVKNRLGKDEFFPVMTLSVAGVDPSVRHIPHYARIVEIAAEIKHYLKSLPSEGKSRIFWDRRTDSSRDVKESHAA